MGVREVKDAPQDDSTDLYLGAWIADGTINGERQYGEQEISKNKRKPNSVLGELGL